MNVLNTIHKSRQPHCPMGIQPSSTKVCITPVTLWEHVETTNSRRLKV